MRLRHKKNAETEIFNCPVVINCTHTGLNKSDNRMGELCEPTLQSRTGELCEPQSFINRTGELCEPQSFFNNNNPIHLELGMGKGRFITELSKKNSDINYIGIERSATIVLKAVDLLTKADARLTRAYSTGELCEPSLHLRTGELCKPNLHLRTGELCERNLHLRTGELCEPNLLAIYPNLRFMCIDIAKLSDIFIPHSIDKIYLNFSDPWPKKRHEIRRLTHRNFLAIYEKLLKPNSTIEFKTDNKDLFDFSLEEIKNSSFKLLEYTYDLHNDAKMNKGNIMTEYEEKFSKIGNKICKLIAIKL